MSEFQFTGSNFIAGKWENGFGLQFDFIADEFRASYRFAQHQQGPPGVAHGGALAALLDEAMTAAAFHAVNEPAFTANLNITYRAPVFLGTEVHISAKIQEIDGRKISIYAQITLADGTIATVASGLFIRLSGVK